MGEGARSEMQDHYDTQSARSEIKKLSAMVETMVRHRPIQANLMFWYTYIVGVRTLMDITERRLNEARKAEIEDE